MASEEITKIEPAPQPPQKGKAVLWVALAVAVIGAVVDVVPAAEAVMPGPWVGKVLTVAGVLGALLRQIMLALNSSGIDMAAKARAGTVDDAQVKDKLGKR